MENETIYDSPRGWVARHISDYVKTGGKKGHRWHGADTLLLTTRGRKTGKLRRTALIYGKDGDDYMVVASTGGAENHPGWYLNLAADPLVRVQVQSEEFEATASTVSGEPRESYWKQMAEIWPDYLKYQKKTEREIPVVRLTRTPD